MTREETVKNLLTELVDMIDNGSQRDLDRVSRHAVLEIQAKYAEHIGATKFWQMRDDIKALPSVNPQEPKTGHWIRDTITDLYHCSECRSIIHQDPKSKDDYCRYCGAKMVDPQESEDKE